MKMGPSTEGVKAYEYLRITTFTCTCNSSSTREAAKVNKNNKNEKPTNLPVPFKIQRINRKSGINVWKPLS